jgi:hypothetical protein
VPEVDPLVRLLDGSMDGGEADLFGSFSPHGRPYMPILPAMSAITESETTIGDVTPVL